MRVDYRYASTPEEREQFARAQKGVFGVMGGVAVVLLVLLLLFLAFAGILGYVFLHNALHLF